VTKRSGTVSEKANRPSLISKNSRTGMPGSPYGARPITFPEPSSGSPKIWYATAAYMRRQSQTGHAWRPGLRL